MKNFNRAGRELSCRQYDKVTLLPSYEGLFNPAKDEYKDRSLLALGRYLCRPLSIGIFLLFINLAIQPAYGQETDGLSEIKPLRIGDRVPEALWDLHLEVVNHPDGKEFIKLKQYKGRVIIIDFWSTYCGACIIGFPKFIKLQNKYEDQIHFLPVTYQPKQIIQKIIKTNDYFEDLKNEVVINDKVLSKYFEHQTIPHVVWIDREGVLRATTSAKHIMPTYIDQILENRMSNWAHKYEQSEWMNSSSMTPRDSTMKQFSYSSVFGYLAGIPRHNVFTLNDSMEGLKTIRYANESIFDMYMRAMGRFSSPIYKNRLISENCDLKKIVFTPQENISVDDWMVANGITYESRISTKMPLAEQRRKMQSDLDFHLGLRVFLETREVDCLELKVTDQALFNKTISTSGEKKVILITDVPNKSISNAPLQTLLEALNYLGNPIPVVSTIDTNIQVNMNLNIKDLLSIHDLNKELRRYGLHLVTTRNNIEVLVFHKNKEV